MMLEGITLRGSVLVSLKLRRKIPCPLFVKTLMGRSTPPFPTSLRLNPTAGTYTQKQIHLSTKLFSPAPILRFTVGKFSQLPPAEGPEVVVLGRSNVGVILYPLFHSN